MGLDFTSLVPSVEVRSTLTPPVRVSFGSSQGIPSPLLRFLKPTIVPLDNSGNPLTTIAPYGEAPSGNMGLVVSLTVLAGIFAIVFLAGRASA